MSGFLLLAMSMWVPTPASIRELIKSEMYGSGLLEASKASSALSKKRKYFSDLDPIPERVNDFETAGVRV
jgi:hypothetical protein